MINFDIIVAFVFSLFVHLYRQKTDSRYYWRVCDKTDPPRPATRHPTTPPASHHTSTYSLIYFMALLRVSRRRCGGHNADQQSPAGSSWPLGRHRGKQHGSIPWSPRHYSSTSNVPTLLLTAARVRCNVCFLTPAPFRKAEPLGLIYPRGGYPSSHAL